MVFLIEPKTSFSWPPRKLLKLGRSTQKAEGVNILSNKPIKMQTFSSLGMAYRIKKLFDVKPDKDDENWGNYNKYNKEEEKCVFWGYCSYKSCSSCIYVCRNVMPNIFQGMDDISVIYTGN